jgi:hypothetical protein
MHAHIIVSLNMPYITAEMKTKDPDWWDHLKPGDSFHMGNPVDCGVCGCESDYWGIGRWMGYPKRGLFVIMTTISFVLTRWHRFHLTDSTISRALLT